MELSRRTLEEWDRDMEQDPGCDLGEPPWAPGHGGHHQHVVENYEECSCGESLPGCWSVTVPDLTPEQQARWDARTCSLCGKVGVLLSEDFWAGRGAEILAGT
jgi:hypothetical protein